jgi:hypothetical protein
MALLAMVTLLVGPTRPARAAGCTVPGTYATIQLAVDDPSCDPINVVSGTYTENVVITRSLTLKGAGAASTTINGGGVGTVISITNGAAPTIEGFTITGGDGSDNVYLSGTSLDSGGGGIFIREATAIVRNNVISGNVGSTISSTNGLGGGILVISSTSPVRIYDNVIQANVAQSVTLVKSAPISVGIGGGIAIGDASSAVITGNQVLSNVAARTDVPSSAATGFGGGIGAWGDSLVVDGNTIQDNLGIDTGLRGFGGGIISFQTPVVTITDNLIVGNTGIISGSDASGGGIYLGVFSGSGQRLTLTGNWVMSNTAGVTITPNAAFGMSNPYVGGGGLRIWGGAAVSDTLILQNNHLLYNVGAVYVTDLNDGSADGGGLSAGRISTTLIISNDISYNTAAIRASTSGTGGWGGSVFGGGIAFWGSQDVTVQDSHIENNVAVEELSADGVETNAAGGGLSLGNFQTAVLTNSWFVGNVAVLSASITSSTGENFGAIGGGIQVDGWERFNDSITIQNNHLIDNLAVQTMTTSGADSKGHPEGGGLLVRNVTTTLILSNEVRGNTAVESLILSGSGGWGGRPAGGGMFLGEGDSLTLSDNRIEDNVAAWRQTVTGVDSGSEGGGIAVTNIPSATLSDNTVTGNTAVVSGSISSAVGGDFSPQGGGIRIGCWDRPTCSLSFSGNEFLSNTTVYTLTVGGSDASGGAQGGGLAFDAVTNASLNGDTVSNNRALVFASASGNLRLYAQRQLGAGQWWQRGRRGWPGGR